jgi:hypothetical protein
MPTLAKTVGVALDLAGCPNRCRHCYIGGGPNRRLPREALHAVADAFWTWRRPGDAAAWFEQVDVSSAYREPDFSDDYKELYELERSLSRREPRRYELLSVWRLARDGDYARWAAAHGPRVCQITFFGGRDATDYFTGRRGAFDDNLAATERLLDAGMIPRWQVFLLKRGLTSLSKVMSLIESMRLRERAATLGAAFDVFAHPPAPDGEAFRIEHERVDDCDLALVPPALLESTRAHFGRIDWETEAAITDRVLAGMVIAPYVPDHQWFFVDADFDVFSNYGDLTPGWRLANLKRDGLTAAFAAFETNAPPAFQAAFHVPDIDLAQRFGRRDSRALYSPGDLKARWVRLYCEAAQQQ